MSDEEPTPPPKRRGRVENLHPWPKGVSPNPGGKPKHKGAKARKLRSTLTASTSPEVMKLIESILGPGVTIDRALDMIGPAAVAALAKDMLSAPDARDRIKAASSLLDKMKADAVATDGGEDDDDDESTDDDVKAFEAAARRSRDAAS